ncbi:MAG: phosphatidate cytidylyltransferase [Treponema sp.]|nr:phosphatidate cytidylyltransferase [Treponema sp.]
MIKVTCAQVGIDIKRQLYDLQKELFRKVIHICTAFIPLLLHYFYVPTLIALALAGILYVIAEKMRMHGKEIPLISDITAAAARKRDENKFVLGPVTLVAGVVLAALLWKEVPAAIGILALSFGDGLASLAGKAIGKIRIPFTFGKTAAGSLTCFWAIFCSSFLVCKNCFVSLVVALIGMGIEILPLKDFDNVLIPVLLGGVAQYLLPHI